ncbi:MAG TPA: hypothetical protein VFC63_10375 [Blastocatellia bacterium]|nr:hypothetical protein [Blastocatellia bacterium]
MTLPPIPPDPVVFISLEGLMVLNLNHSNPANPQHEVYLIDLPTHTPSITFLKNDGSGPCTEFHVPYAKGDLGKHVSVSADDASVLPAQHYGSDFIDPDFPSSNLQEYGWILDYPTMVGGAMKTGTPLFDPIVISNGASFTQRLSQLDLVLHPKKIGNPYLGPRALEMGIYFDLTASGQNLVITDDSAGAIKFPYIPGTTYTIRISNLCQNCGASDFDEYYDVFNPSERSQLHSVNNGPTVKPPVPSRCGKAAPAAQLSVPLTDVFPCVVVGG